MGRQALHQRWTRRSAPRPLHGRALRQPTQPATQTLLRPPPRRRQTTQTRPDCRHAQTDRPHEPPHQKPKLLPCTLNTVAGLSDGIPLGFRDTIDTLYIGMNVREVLEKSSYDEIVETLASLSASSDPSSVEQLQEFLKVRDGHTFSKHTTPRIVCLSLLQKGLPGIKSLVAAFPDAPGASYPRSIIEALWYASEGRFSRH